LATDSLTAFLESVGPDYHHGLLSQAFVDERVLFDPVHVTSTCQLADTASNRAREFGVTAELFTEIPYGQTQRWAKWFHRGGFDGLRYRTRFSPAARPSSIALFGSDGIAEDRPFPSAERIPASVLEGLEREYGIRIAPMPGSGDLGMV
jgi:hypothetical protein